MNKEWAVGRFVFRQHQQFSVASKFLFVLLLYVYWIRFFLYVVFCFGRHHSHMFRGTSLSHFFVDCYEVSDLHIHICFWENFWRIVVFIGKKWLFLRKKGCFLHTIGAISAYTIVAVDFSRNYPYIQMMFRAFFLMRALT